MGTQNAQGQFLNPNPYGYYDPYARTGSAYVQTTAVPSSTGKGKQFILEEFASFFSHGRSLCVVRNHVVAGWIGGGIWLFVFFLIFCFCWIASVVMMESAVTAIEAVTLVMDGYLMFLHKDGSVF